MKNPLGGFDPAEYRDELMDYLYKGLDNVIQNSQTKESMREPDDIMDWILTNQILNEKGKQLEFQNHPFLVDIYRDMSPFQAIKKCSQVGCSVMMVLKNTYLAGYRDFTIIYTLPTRELIYEFVPTKVDVIIDKNPVLQTMIKSKDSSTSKKRCMDGFILYKGTFGERESIMTSSDLNIYDECDRSNQDVIDGLASRLTHSEFRGQWWFSNPTFPNIGVCKQYEDSDQKKWHVTCNTCHREFPLQWPVCVDYQRGIYACPNCGSPINDDQRRGGRWVSYYPSRAISGYHISQMMAPWITPQEMIKAEEEKRPDVFHNFYLGEGYYDGTASVNRELIKSCQIKRLSGNDESLAVGIDQGAKFHCTVGPRHSVSRLVVLDTWEQVEELIRPDNVKIVVIDAQPEHRDATKLAVKYPYKVYLAYYIDDPNRPKDLDPVEWKVGEGVLLAERTGVIDNTVHRFTKRDINLYIDDKTPFFSYSKRKGDTYLEHWEAMYVTRTQDKHGNEIRRWMNSAPDHWAHSTVYWDIASRNIPRISHSVQEDNYEPIDPYTGY
jgi:hypothetical protein